MPDAHRSCNLGSDVALRYLIVDDNASFREEVSALLQEQGLDVVATAASGEEALRLIEELRPDVALIDIDLGGQSGFDLARRVRGGAGRAVPEVILISTHDDSEYADLIAASPAAGFVAKTDLSAAAIHQLLDDANPSGERRDT